MRLFMILFYHYEIQNEDRLKNIQSPVIVAMNHISWFDPPCIGAIAPFELAFLAKAELFRNPIFGGMIARLNSIPIHRGKPDKEAISTALNALKNKKSLLLFPEGTRKGKSVKPGVGMFAVKMQKDILPIYIENSDKLLSCAVFRRKLIIKVGQLVKISEFNNLTEDKKSYQIIAETVYKKILDLKYD